MTSLLTNIAAMTALTTLKGIGQQLDTTSTRISTGQRVSNASDNAAYWSIATAVRTDNASLSAVKDALGLGASSIDIAYNGLTAVLGNLSTLRAKLQTALQPGADRSKIQTEITALQATMKATAASSVSSGENWLAVNSAAPLYRAIQRIPVAFSRGIDGTVRLSNVEIRTPEIALYDAAASGGAVPATTARVTGGAALPATLDLSGGQSVRFALQVDGNGPQDLVLDAARLTAAVPDLTHVTPPQVVAALNNEIAGNPALAGRVTAGLDVAGRLSFETTATGAARSLVVDRTSAGASGTGTDLVTNGGFEGGLAGWTVSGDATYVSPGVPAHSGARSLALGTVTGTTTVSRTLATVPGQTYTLEFWLQNPGGTPSSFTASWGGTPLMALTNTAAQPYTRETFTVTATGTSTVLSFEAQQVPSYWHLDDISVTPVTTADLSLGYGSGSSGQLVGTGTDAIGGLGRGLLDTVDIATGFSVQSIDIAQGGTGLISSLINQVEGVIARVTDAGAKLGAASTQVGGQRAFLDTLMKANARAIGILVDADIEEESTRLKALQTQQQLALQALSIANVSSQTILTLFRQ